jgi:hypothetical protein
LHFSLIVSDLAVRNRALAQEIALLRLDLEERSARAGVSPRAEHSR